MDDTWFLDELAHAGAEHLDPAFVAAYDEKQGHPDPSDDIAAFTAHGLGTDSTVIDLAAGTGQFAVPAATHFGEVIAVDPSGAMRAALRARADREGAGNLRVEAGGFLRWSPREPADGLFTRNGLHQLPDFWKALALRRIAGMLRPGGLFRVRDLIYDFDPDDAPVVFEQWFAHAATDPSKGYTEEDYRLHIRTEHSTFRWLFEPMLERAGFEIEDAGFRGRLYGAYTCVKL